MRRKKGAPALAGADARERKNELSISQDINQFITTGDFWEGLTAWLASPAELELREAERA